MQSSNQRRVVDHTIISDALPALEIKVDPTFEYVGILSFVLKEIALVERVIFAERQASKTTRLFIVQFEGILEGVDFTYKYPTTNPITLGNYSYQHGVYMYSNAESVREAPGAESDRTTQFLGERGYVHEDGLAMSRFARIVDDARRHEIIIFYQEILSSLGHSLETYSQLSREKQQSIDQSLTERSLQNFQVTDLG
jgi:hypothetical protein